MGGGRCGQIPCSWLPATVRAPGQRSAAAAARRDIQLNGGGRGHPTRLRAGGGGVDVGQDPTARKGTAVRRRPKWLLGTDGWRFELSVAIPLLIGLALLVAGGDVVVRGAGKLAISAGIKPLVVGLTVVAFCTSAPELAASITAALGGSPGLAVGNVLGSNIANVGLILGLAGLLRPISVQSTVLAREVPVMIAASAGLVVLGWDGTLSRLDGLTMLAALVVYLAFMVRAELRAQEPAVEAEVVESVGRTGPAWQSVALVLVGVAMLVLGANQLVGAATTLARISGISEEVVGLTVMAVGTSLPELAASLAAARKGQGDIVLGNVVGSNIFNILCILGATAVISPIEGGMQVFSRDLWVSLGVATALWPMLGRGRTLFRHEAALLLIGYGAYMWWIV